jgi:sporulation protein YlmC with PRC-barrel domain
MQLRRLAIAGLIAGAAGLSPHAVLAQPAPSPTAPPPTAPSVSGQPPAPTAPAAPLGDLFLSPAGLDLLWGSRDLTGRAVYNIQDEKLGTIEDILFDADGRIAAAVLGMGGVLGLGKKSVAVAYKAIRLTRDDSGQPRVTLDIARTTLEAAPDYTPAKGRNPG